MTHFFQACRRIPGCLTEFPKPKPQPSCPQSPSFDPCNQLRRIRKTKEGGKGGRRLKQMRRGYFFRLGPILLSPSIVVVTAGLVFGWVWVWGYGGDRPEEEEEEEDE